MAERQDEDFVETGEEKPNETELRVATGMGAKHGARTSVVTRMGADCGARTIVRGSTVVGGGSDVVEVLHMGCTGAVSSVCVRAGGAALLAALAADTAAVLSADTVVTLYFT